MITPEDEKLYNLKPLPDVPFCGRPMADALQRTYERVRHAWRYLYPSAPKRD